MCVCVCVYTCMYMYICIYGRPCHTTKALDALLLQVAAARPRRRPLVLRRLLYRSHAARPLARTLRPLPQPRLGLHLHLHRLHPAAHLLPQAARRRRLPPGRALLERAHRAALSRRSRLRNHRRGRGPRQELQLRGARGEGERRAARAFMFMWDVCVRACVQFLKVSAWKIVIFVFLLNLRFLPPRPED